MSNAQTYTFHVIQNANGVWASKAVIKAKARGRPDSAMASESARIKEAIIRNQIMELTLPEVMLIDRLLSENIRVLKAKLAAIDPKSSRAIITQTELETSVNSKHKTLVRLDELRNSIEI